MEILLENLIKTVVIIGLALALGGLKYTLVAILSFAILRFFTFGLHCQSGVMCLLLSVFLDVISPILIKDIYVGTIARSVLMITYIFIIFRYAPADTENHPFFSRSEFAAPSAYPPYRQLLCDRSACAHGWQHYIGGGAPYGNSH